MSTKKKKPTSGAAIATPATSTTNGATAAAAADETDDDDSWISSLASALLAVAFLQVLYWALKAAYEIRLFAIHEYGRIIHEFDPYFNYRATVYLYDHGWKAFSQWFDYQVWYPLGRPVGTTIYPGMQVTAVLLKEWWLTDWSINDICCFIPAWFGVTATLGVAWMTYEATRPNCITAVGSTTILNDIPVVSQLYRYLIVPVLTFVLDKIEPLVGGRAALGLRLSQKRTAVWWTPVACATAAALIMSIVPAHLLRSVAGGYDNESIAMTAMVVTYSMWMTSLRGGHYENSPDVNLTLTCINGVLTGLAYFYMVAAWGGYVFVLNLIGVHASVLVVLGRYSTKLHRAYTLFYLVGTALATQVPVVGWTPLKSLEQMGPLVAFCGMQLIEFCQVMKRRRQLNTRDTWKLRVQVFGAAAALAALLAYCLVQAGYFGPISSRVRGLFVQHTKTGNPLVDSVAEHQAASAQAYFQYLHHVCYLLPAGMAFVLLNHWTDASSFLLVYGVTAYYFSHRMVRLILLTAPIASAVGGIGVGRLVSWGALNAILVWDHQKAAAITAVKDIAAKDKTTKQPLAVTKSNTITSLLVRAMRLGLTILALYHAHPYAKQFYDMCHDMAKHISHPTIVQKARTQSGQDVLVDDYREAYTWLRDHTPTDARVMAWWDYGYQISGIANRTTIADGNTWNHEHIALLGRILTGPEKEAHRIARHLADYVLIWAGGGGDDLAKSPHLRRIANSVYRGLCREPTCRDFGFRQRDHAPTESLKGSLLYTLHSNGLVAGVQVDPNRFQEVYKSKYGKVRIYKIKGVSKESKEWVANNRVCDAPGSWYCPGQYPPALEKILADKRDFAQLEDFNRGAADEDYTKEYLKNLNKKDHSSSYEPEEKPSRKVPKLTSAEIDELNKIWENDEITTALWEAIAQNRIADLKDLITANPEYAHKRSEDGRGPMWWAHEYGNDKAIGLLKSLGISEMRKDVNGITPIEISKKKA